MNFKVLIIGSTSGLAIASVAQASDAIIYAEPEPV